MFNKGIKAKLNELDRKVFSLELYKPTSSQIFSAFEVLVKCKKIEEVLSALMDHLGLEFKDEPAKKIIVTKENKDVTS